MDIKGKTILILGGWGLVGQSICRRLIPEKPGKIVITSLHEGDADSIRNQIAIFFKFFIIF